MQANLTPRRGSNQRLAPIRVIRRLLSQEYGGAGVCLSFTRMFETSNIYQCAIAKDKAAHSC
jgi:hypothetical protein